MNAGQLQPILEQYPFQVKGLLRKYKIAGELNEETIKKGYDLKGEAFMMELLQIITPAKQESGFWGLFEGKSKQTAAASTPEDDANATLDSMISANESSSSSSSSSSGSTGGFWKFFDNVLTTVDKTGKTIGDFKANTTSTLTTDQQMAQAQTAAMAEQQASTNNKIIYWIGGILIVIIIIILILRKND